MKLLKLIKKLSEIDKECDKYPELEKALKPYIDAHMTKETINKQVAKEFIKLYHKEKKKLYG